jgi:hypothetical protein
VTTPSDPRQPDAEPGLDSLGTDELASVGDPAVGENPNGHAAPDGAQATSAAQQYSLYAERPSARNASRQLIRRPPEMWGGAVFLTLSALPLLILGGGVALLPGQYGTNLRDKINAAGTSVNADSLILVFRIGGALLLVLALVLIALAWGAVRPRSRARIGATVLAAVEVVGLAFAMIVTSPDPVSVGVLLLAGAGVVLLHLPRSEEFMLARR